MYAMPDSISWVVRLGLHLEIATKGLMNESFLNVNSLKLVSGTCFCVGSYGVSSARIFVMSKDLPTVSSDLAL